MHRVYATLTLALLLSVATGAHAQMSDKKLADARDHLAKLVERFRV